MRAPAFWGKSEPTLPALLLQPFGFLYGRVTAARMRQKPRAAATVPVICVGNFIAGGAGKTPTAIALAERLTAMGQSPAFLTRGYGGKTAGPHIVNTESDTAADVGDEALLLAAHAPTIVSRKRPAGAALAEKTGASVIIMDDGFQNPSLKKDCSLIAIDGTYGVGNGLSIPAGPLRAPVEAQMPEADALVIVGSATESDRTQKLRDEAQKLGRPVFEARSEATCKKDLKDVRVLAFAGIGRPEKFFATVETLGGDVVTAKAFPDHHPYSPEDARAILDLSERGGLLPVTTAKDAARFKGSRKLDILRERTSVVDLKAVFDDPDGLSRLLAPLFG